MSVVNLMNSVLEEPFECVDIFWIPFFGFQFHRCQRHFHGFYSSEEAFPLVKPVIEALRTGLTRGKESGNYVIICDIVGYEAAITVNRTVRGLNMVDDLFLNRFFEFWYQLSDIVGGCGDLGLELRGSFWWCIGRVANGVNDGGVVGIHHF